MQSIWRGAAIGAVGGTLGATVMVAFNHLLGSSGFGREDLGRHHATRHIDAKPNDSDGTISDEPASRKAMSRISQAATGQPLDEPQKDVVGTLAHHAFGAAAGALYGAVAVRYPAVVAAGGLPYGAFVWLTAAEAGLPLTGLARTPDHYPPARHLASLATHLAFGATVECVRRALTARR